MIGRTPKSLCLRLELLEDRWLLSGGASVTGAEQLFVYMLNRARHDPVAYQVEQNLSVDLSYVTPRPPLAVNNSLFDSSRFHAGEMAGSNYFAHQSQVTGDWPNKMARDQGYQLPSWWADDANYIESIAAGYATAADTLRALIVDQGVPSLGHRDHLLGISSFTADDREIGVGYGYNQSAYYRHYWAIQGTRSDPADMFLTGVVFTDSNGNRRYDSGEGLSGVTLTAGGLGTTTNAAGGWSLQVTAGTYTLSASGAGFSGTAGATVTLGSDSVEVDFVAGQSWGIVNFDDTSTVAQPLGTIELLELADLDPSAGELWYRTKTTRPGFLTLEASPLGPPGGAELTLYDAAFSQLATSTLVGGSQRIDFQASAAGETYYFKLTGTDTAVDLRLANLVQTSPDGTQVTVYGTAGNDVFQAIAGSPHVMVINALRYESTVVTNVQFTGGGGSDSVTLTGSAGNDNFVGRPGYAKLHGTGFSFEARDFENVYAYAGAGGNDTAKLYDSPGNDKLVGTPGFAKLSGSGFLIRAESFDAVHSYATSGGTDTARLYDSPGDDNFYATPSEAALSGDGFYNRAKFFDEVQAFATAGGTDTARLYDSSGDDNFYATPAEAALSGSGFRNRVKFFETVHAYADEGGSDEAILYDSSGDDRFFATSSHATMHGNGFYNRVHLFEDVWARAEAGGHDVAKLYDSPGNDNFVATPTYAALSGGAFVNRAQLFDGVHAFATAGGHDVAKLYDSSGNDTFVGTSVEGALFGGGYYNRAKYFEAVHAFATAGGHDVARLFDSARNDTFVATPEFGALSGDAFYNRAKFFEEVRAEATAGGYDKAYLYDSSSADLLKAQGSWARLSNAALDFLHEARSFDYVKATATTSGDTKDVTLPLDFTLDLAGPWQDL